MDDVITINGEKYHKQEKKYSNNWQEFIDDYHNNKHKGYSLDNHGDIKFGGNMLLIRLPSINGGWSLEVFEFAKQFIKEFPMCYIDHSLSYKNSRLNNYWLVILLNRDSKD